MNSKHRRLHTLMFSPFQNALLLRPQRRVRGRRAAGRLLYLEYLEGRVLLSAQSVSDISEIAHHNTTLAFQTVDFTNAFADTNGGSLTEIKFTAPPAHGALILNGSTVTLGQIIDRSDIPNLSYVPDNNFSGQDVCDWNGSDGGSNVGVNPVSPDHTSPTRFGLPPPPRPRPTA